jgi:hypothetical protein
LELLVDGQVRECPQKATTLGELVVVLREEAAGDGRAVTDIRLDGEELLPADEAEAAARPLAEIGRTEISTAPAREWGRHGLGEAASAMGRLADEFREIAELLRGGEHEAAVERFGGAVGAYGQLIQATVNSAALAGVPAPPGLQAAVEGVTAAMKEVAPALEARDAVAAADLAEYELAERLGELGAKVKEMTGQ